MKRRYLGLIVPIILLAAVIAPRVQAAGLVVSCDQTAVKTFCSNDTNIACTSNSACGSGTCSVAKNVFVNPCTVDTFVEQFIVLSQYALTLVIVLGMLMMVFGGFQFITAAGRPQKVDDGKRIIEGTIVGLIISFVAFIIVNFVIAAVTGSPAARRNINPFGAIARVFVNPEDKNISRPFNTTGQSSDTGKCYSLNSGWDKDCTDQLHCADSSKDSGEIHNLQQKLTDLHCNPQGVDGCFGPKTLEALRRFQIANDLPPTGQVDQTTGNKLTATPKACDADAATSALVNGVSGELPTAQDSTQAREITGCCIVRNGGAGLFCANQVSQRTCNAQNGEFHAGAINCSTDAATGDTCGYCYNSSGSCFEAATDFWCTQVVKPAMSFQAHRTCGNEAACQGGCAEELLNLPP